MSYESLAAQIASDIIARSGVGLDQWTPEKQTQLASTAASIAAQILYPPELIRAMANAQYEKTGSAFTFGSEVGTDDYDWTTESVANNAGRQSEQWDRGADGTARPGWYRYRFHVQAQATPTVGNVCRLFLKTSDGTHPANDDGTGDLAVSAEDKLKNLLPLKPAIVDQAAANIEYVSEGIVHITARYVQAVLWNAMGSTITADAAETKLTLTELFPEIQ